MVIERCDVSAALHRDYVTKKTIKNSYTNESLGVENMDVDCSTSTLSSTDTHPGTGLRDETDLLEIGSGSIENRATAEGVDQAMLCEERITFCVDADGNDSDNEMNTQEEAELLESSRSRLKENSQPLARFSDDNDAKLTRKEKQKKIASLLQQSGNDIVLLSPVSN